MWVPVTIEVVNIYADMLFVYLYSDSIWALESIQGLMLNAMYFGI